MVFIIKKRIEDIAGGANSLLRYLRILTSMRIFFYALMLKFCQYIEICFSSMVSTFLRQGRYASGFLHE